MKMTVIATVAIAVVALSVANAAVLIDRNGVTWEGTFEGDTVNLTTAGMPPAGTTPPFSTFDANTTNRSLVGGALQLVTTSVSQSQSFSNNFGMTQSSLMTVEWRVNVDTSQPFDSASGFGGVIVVADGKYLSFNLFADKFEIQNSGSLVQDIALDTTQAITYRVTYDGSLSTDKWNLYADGALVWSSGSLVASNFAPVANEVIFGDYTSGAFYGASNYYFISWTDEGAFAPVPEPANLAIMGLAVMALFGIRKRARLQSCE